MAFMAAKVEGEVERVQEVGGKGRGSGSLLMNLAAKRAEVEEEYVEKEYVAEEEVERFQDLENVKVVSENDKGITTRNTNASERVLSWRETAARAGVVTMVTHQEDESNFVEPAQPHGKKRKLQKSIDLLRQNLPKIGN